MEKESMKPGWYEVAEVALVYKTKVKASQRPQVNSPEDIYKILVQIWDMDRIELVEDFKALFLNRNNKVLGVLDVSSGGITGTIADPRIILCAAIKANAVNIILAHNHPSGSTKPSSADEQLTQKIKQAAKYLDMQILDHIIITAEGYLSFAEEGLL